MIIILRRRDGFEKKMVRSEQSEIQPYYHTVDHEDLSFFGKDLPDMAATVHCTQRMFRIERQFLDENDERVVIYKEQR